MSERHYAMYDQKFDLEPGDTMENRVRNYHERQSCGDCCLHCAILEAAEMGVGAVVVTVVE